MPKPSTLLRVASILAAVQYIAHTFLFLSATPTHGPAERAVIDAMHSHRFGVAGFARSYWDFYFGYGLLTILSGVIRRDFAVAHALKRMTLPRYDHLDPTTKNQTGKRRRPPSDDAGGLRFVPESRYRLRR